MSALYISGTNTDSQISFLLKECYDSFEEVTTVVDGIGKLRISRNRQVYVFDQTLGMSFQHSIDLIRKFTRKEDLFVLTNRSGVTSTEFQVIKLPITQQTYTDLRKLTGCLKENIMENWKLSFDRLKALANGDQSFMDSMIKTYIEELPIYASELESAINDLEVNEIGRLAHKVKNPLNMVGIDELDSDISFLDELAISESSNYDLKLVISLAKKVKDCTEKVVDQLRSLPLS